MIIFHNPGEIDIRGATIAGLSAKESKSPIGYFGTGLKYSIACILRWGGKITIYSGISKYDFEAEDISFRGQEFQQITMNGEPLGFTTEYGKNWQPWQVFRELYANARDEGGGVYLDELSSCKGEGFTHILVDCPKLIEPFYDRDNIILPSDYRWDFQTGAMQFRSTQAKGLFYRGVRVHDQPALYTWNMLSQLHLTEDRTLQSIISVSSWFDEFIVQDLHDIEIIMNLLSIKYEETEPVLAQVIELDGEPTSRQRRPLELTLLDWFSHPRTASQYHSDAFKSACTRLYQRNPIAYRDLRSYVKSIDESIVNLTNRKLTDREERMLEKAKELVALFGFENEIAQVPIHVQELGTQTLGLYEHNTIYLSPRLFDQGTKQLVATLYEECYHHRTAHSDCTYDMQNNLFNIIISLNEELHKVIC